MKRAVFWGLVGLTLAVYATMLTWSLPTVAAAARGLVPFDMRPGGYGLAEAQAFLSALSAEGRDFYRNVQQRFDLVYPGLVALTLGLAIMAAAPPGFGRWRSLAIVLAAPVAVFDYLENHAVATMLDAGPGGLTAELVAEASGWTVLKSGASTVVMSVLLLQLLWKGVRRLYPAARRLLARRPNASRLAP